MLDKFKLKIKHFPKNLLHFQILDTINNEIVYEYEYIPEKKMLINTWKAYIIPEAHNLIYNYIGKYNYQNSFPVLCSITDMRGFDGSFEPTLDWFLEEYMPKAVKAGFRANANIKSKDFFAQLSTEDMDIRINGLFLQQTFDSKDKAIAWLDTKPWENK